MGPNKYQWFIIAIIALLWLGVGNIVIFHSIGYKTPKGWGKILLLIIVTIALSYFVILLQSK